jgi:hypothetical protein
MNIVKFRIKIAVLFTRFVGWFSGNSTKKVKNKSNELKGKILVDSFAKEYLPVIENLPQKQIKV